LHLPPDTADLLSLSAANLLPSSPFLPPSLPTRTRFPTSWLDAGREGQATA